MVYVTLVFLLHCSTNSNAEMSWDACYKPTVLLFRLWRVPGRNERMAMLGAQLIAKKCKRIILY